MFLESFTSLTQFGTAGVMGALWLWERLLSRKREAELDAAHRALMQQQEELAVLVRLVRHNTQAMERFDQTQKQLKHLLEKMHDQMPRRAA